jgi:mRNA-degrading endonuclease RelE of RelBE toxin-antitoxin system
MPVELTPEAAGQLDRLPRVIHARVLEIIGRLERWPEVSGAKPMVRELKGSFRIRTGAYRVVFRVRGQRVIIWRIDNRRDVYE